MDRSFDDLGTPLHEVTFCVVDLETTGASAAMCDITEVGAARYRGGECLGTFQTLVNPGAPLDPTVSALTGITDAMLRPAPPVSAVLPTLAEFVGGSVLVGHNLRFDVSFLDAALTAGDRRPVGLRTVDTVALARRLVRDEVPDCRLGTLAHHLRLDHLPTHRALDDVLATADLLHLLLERAATFGVTVLDDLLQLPRLAAHPHAGKLRLTNRLPRAPGVYVLRDGQGAALHVDRADDDLRRRVRWLFSGADQRLAGPLLREVQAIDHLACPSPLAAAVAEIRLVQALRPRRARRFADWHRYRYVKLGGTRNARLSVARAPGKGPGRYLGPLPSTADARAVVDAVDAVTASHPGTSDDPGAGDPTGRDGLVAADLFDRPERLRAALQRRVAEATGARRYARAELARTQAAAVDDALDRQRRIDALRRAGHVVLDLDGDRVELAAGRLLRAGAAGAPEGPAGPAGAAGSLAEVVFGAVEPAPDDQPLPCAHLDEVSCIAGWFDRHAHRLRPVHVTGELSCPVPRQDAVPGTGTPPDGVRGPGPSGLRCATC